MGTPVVLGMLVWFAWPPTFSLFIQLSLYKTYSLVNYVCFACLETLGAFTQHSGFIRSKPDLKTFGLFVTGWSSFWGHCITSLLSVLK